MSTQWTAAERLRQRFAADDDAMCGAPMHGDETIVFCGCCVTEVGDGELIQWNDVPLELQSKGTDHGAA